MLVLLRILTALRDYFAATDDPTPEPAQVGDPAQAPSRNTERLLRLLARAHVEEGQLIQDLRQRVAALEARLAAAGIP